LLLYASTIASSIGASRAVAIPFIAASFYFFQKRNLITSILLAYFALVALETAFYTRSNPSYVNFWLGFLRTTTNIDIVNSIQIILTYSFPGLTTIQASMHNPGELSLEAFFRFIVYLLPIPSQLLPASLFSQISLSESLGIDRTILGINYDIYSEGIFWFGVDAAWIYTLILAALTLLPYYIVVRIAKIQNNDILIACLMANAWMIFGGQVFILRAGSRAGMMLSLIVMGYIIFRRSKQPNHKLST
jgi:hypothetical protein